MFIPAVVALTSIGVYWIATRRARLKPAELPRAIRRMVVCLGMATLFFATNVFVGVAMVFLGRLFLHEFVSLYLVNDITLVAFSLAQSLTYMCWRGPC